jgi:hypothetical protein
MRGIVVAFHHHLRLEKLMDFIPAIEGATIGERAG